MGTCGMMLLLLSAFSVSTDALAKQMQVGVKKSGSLRGGCTENTAKPRIIEAERTETLRTPQRLEILREDCAGAFGA